MRVKALLAGPLAAGLLALCGCHHDKHRVSIPQVEEYALPPPGDPRFDNPPTAEYRRPPSKRDDPSLMNKGKMGAGPGNPLNPGGF